MKVRWQTKEVGDVCDVVGGGTPSKANADFYRGDIPWATVRDMRSETIADTEYKISKSAVENSSTHIIPKGNVVIATRVGLGKICLLEKDTAINQDLRGVIPKDSRELLSSYLFWWFKSISDRIVKEGTGATVQGVKLPFIKGLELPLPIVAEQKMIVKKLDEVFEKVSKAKENAEKNLQNSKELLESYLQSVFAKPGKDWEERNLSGCFKLKSGDNLTSKMMGTNGKFPVFGGNGIAGMHNQFNLSGSNVIIGRVGALCGNVRHITENIWLTDNAFKIIDFKYEFDHSFLTYLLNFKNLRSFARQAAQPVISNSSLKDVLLQFPKSLSEQKAIVKKLDALSAETKKLQKIYEQKLTDLEELKKSVLQQAFTGKL